MSERRRDGIALGILALLPTLLFLDVLLGINSFYLHDITSYYYPAKKALRDIVLGGHFPYWNPFFSAGQPMAANPEHEVFYPLTWLILLPRYDLAYHLLTLVHVYIALFSMYALLRSMDVGRPPAFLGSVSFGLGGLLLSTLNLLPYLFSVAWLPLTCLFTRRFLLRHERRDAVLASVFLGLQLLIGEPTTAFQSGIILGIYAIYRGIHDSGDLRGVLRRVAIIGAISVFALLIAAAQVFPALDHFRDSVRTRGFDFYTVSHWSTPPVRLAELVFPHLFGEPGKEGRDLYWAEIYGERDRPFFLGIYPGLLISVAMIGGLLARTRGSGMMLAIGTTSLILAAGEHTPLLKLLHERGIADWLRYPEKFVIMGVFAAVVFGAVTLDRMLRGEERLARWILACAAGVTVLALGVWTLSLTPAYEAVFRAVWRVEPTSETNRMIGEWMTLSRQGWLLATARGVLLVLLLRNVARVRPSRWMTLASVFVLLDLGAMVPSLAPRVPSSFHREPPAAVHELPPQRDAYRVFHMAGWNNRTAAARFYSSPNPYTYWLRRNGLFPESPAAHGIRMGMDIDFDLTHLLATADFTESAWELSSARPRDWGDVIASMSNIWFVGIYRPPAEALAAAGGDGRRIQPIRFVERAHHSRYYFARKIQTIRDRHEFVRVLAAERDPLGLALIHGPSFTPARGVVRDWKETPNSARIEVEAAGRAYLVMSVTPHKYWRVTIDGAETTAFVTNVGYQGVIVPAGRHVVEMRYRNPVVDAGAAVSLASLLGLGLLARRGRRGSTGPVQKSTLVAG